VVDRDLILRKLADVDQYLLQLGEYRDISVEQYRGDWKSQRIIERTLQLAIETSLDVVSHVIADRGLRVPATYAEAFDVLGEARLIDENLREAMVGMAKFRNVIVREYARIDPEIAVRILRDHLGDCAFQDGSARLALATPPIQGDCQCGS
jgi:uncharacterized protein YutE (UPF0331/DUF86 family)